MPVFLTLEPAEEYVTLQLQGTSIHGNSGTPITTPPSSLGAAALTALTPQEQRLAKLVCGCT